MGPERTGRHMFGQNIIKSRKIFGKTLLRARGISVGDSVANHVWHSPYLLFCVVLFQDLSIPIQNDI